MHRNQGGVGGLWACGPPKFHSAPRPCYMCKCIAISAKPSRVAMSAPLPIKKLKKTTLLLLSSYNITTMT